jgi:polyhydroxyalkanoate synthesis regulator phasin
MTKAKNESWVDTTVKMGDDLFKTGRNVYLAGLGAVATAGEEARSVYDRFVSKGEEFEKSQDNLFNKARDVGRKVETRVQETVSATLNRAGVPSRDEIHTLVHRVEELTHKVDQLAASK